MAEDPHATDQWAAKTGFLIGVDLTLPPPEMRYQLLGGQMFTLQLMPKGDIVRGVIRPQDAGFSLDAGEGWYDADGQFLGDDPSLPAWE